MENQEYDESEAGLLYSGSGQQTLVEHEEKEGRRLNGKAESIMGALGRRWNVAESLAKIFRSCDRMLRKLLEKCKEYRENSLECQNVKKTWINHRGCSSRNIIEQ